MKGKSWTSVLVESCAIVVSILLAFGIDAWWDDWKDSQREHAYLVSLRDDVLRTIRENERVLSEQSEEHERIVSIAEKVRSGAELPPDFRTTFPTVTLPAESMDTYRDLVASGGTTIISSPDVRRAMAHMLQQVEYNDLAEKWALDLATSARMVILETPPESMSRAHLGDVWNVYIDLCERLVDGKKRLRKAAQDALIVLDSELGTET